MARCNCRDSKRLTSFSSIKSGDHIYMGGNHSLFNWTTKQRGLYNHHALVKKVDHIDGSSAILTLIHFTSTPYAENIVIRKTTEFKDLHYDEIYVVKYRHEQFPADHVMNTAESLLESDCVYNISSYNCEHFCHLCCTQNHESIQVENVAGKVPYVIGSIGLIFVMIYNIAWQGIASFAFILFYSPLIYLLIQMFRGYFCCREFLYRLFIFCFRDAIYYCLLVYVSDITYGMNERMAVCVAVSTFVLILVLVWAVPHLTNKLLGHVCHWANDNKDTDKRLRKTKPLLWFKQEFRLGQNLSYLPQINVDHRRAKRHATMTLDVRYAHRRTDVKEGQIIQFNDNDGQQVAISTKVEYHSTCHTKLRVTAVHYGEENNVVEKQFRFDLSYDNIKIINYHPLYRFNTAKVIKEARQKIGEKSYNYFTRSSHLVKQIFQKDRYKQVCRQNQIYPGAVIFCRVLMHDAVVTAIENENRNEDAESNCDDQTLLVTIIHYSERREVEEEQICINMREQFYVKTFAGNCVDHMKEKLYVKTFAGYCTYPKNMTVLRAISRKGERRFSSYNTSDDLVHWAKVVQTPVIVTFKSCPGYWENQLNDLENKDGLLVPITGEQYEQFQRIAVYVWSDLTVGSIVEYQHYRLRYIGILTKSDQDKGEITVYHFRNGSVFTERTVNIHVKKLNLKQETIWMYRCHPLDCREPDDIIRRASGGKILFWGGVFWDLVGWGLQWKYCKWCVLKSKRTKQQSLNKSVQVSEINANGMNVDRARRSSI